MMKTDRFILIEETLIDLGLTSALKDLYLNGDISDDEMEVYVDSKIKMPKLLNAFDGFKTEVKEALLSEIWKNHNDFKHITSMDEFLQELESSSIFTEARIIAMLNLINDGGLN